MAEPPRSGHWSVANGRFGGSSLFFLFIFYSFSCSFTILGLLCAYAENSTQCTSSQRGLLYDNLVSLLIVSSFGGERRNYCAIQ